MIKTYSTKFGNDLTNTFKPIFKDFIFVGNPNEALQSKGMTYDELLELIITSNVPKKTLVISTSQDDYKYLLEYLKDSDIALVHFDYHDADYKIRQPVRTITHQENTINIPNDNTVVVIGTAPENLDNAIVIKEPFYGINLPNVRYVVTEYDGPFEGYFSYNGSCSMIHIGHKPWNRSGLPEAYYKYRLSKKIKNKTSELLKQFEPKMVKFLKALPSITEEDRQMALRIQTYKGLNNDVRSLYSSKRPMSVYDQALIKAFGNRHAKVDKDGMIYMLDGGSMISRVVNTTDIIVIKSDKDIITLGLGFTIPSEENEYEDEFID